MIDVVTPKALWELVKHAGNWVRNLQRAKEERKKESVNALRKVITAARKTAVYIRQLNDTGIRSHEKESELSILWTELSFALEDLDIKNLANRCLIKGKHWADPQTIDKNTLKKADVSLDKMELLASEILREINS